MDTVMLPLVWPGTEVAAALDMLRARMRAGVVQQNFDQTYRLLYAGDLLRARAAGIGTIAGVPGGYPVLLLGLGDARDFAIDLVRPGRTWAAYENLLQVRGVHYALAGESSDTAMIVTLHEEETRVLSATGGYECTGTPTHYFPEPSVNPGDPCPLYPACSTTGGTRPVIRPA